MIQHTLEKYDMKLPNKSLLISLTVIGWLLIALGVGMFVITVIQFFSGDPQYYPDTGLNQPLFIEWYCGVIVFLVGVILASIAWYTFTKHYRNVYNGIIVSRDTEDDPGIVVNGVGFDPGLKWVMLIEGYTHANELRRQWRPVNAGLWQDAKIGDFVSFK
jgi:hypothetical protein